MDATLNRKSLALGVPGIALQIVGWLLPVIVSGGGVASSGRTAPAPSAAIVGLGLLLTLAGTALLIGGLAFYARAKGQSGWWGFLGLLSIVGLIVLAVLPDREKALRR